MATALALACQVRECAASVQFTVTRYCSLGWYCPEGSQVPTADACGTSQFHCPLGSGLPLPVPVGYVGVGTVPNLYATAPCPAGFSCSGGQQLPCDNGKFANVSGHSVCRQCLPGSYAVSNDTYGTINCTACPAGSFCQRGSSSPTPCDSGLYAPNEGSSACQLCDAGKYQTDTGSSLCQTCPAGYKPTEARNSRARLQRSVSCRTFCFLGSSVPTLCGDPSVFCPVGASFPLVVPAGNYSLPDNSSLDLQRTDMAPCNRGHYCAVGSSRVDLQACKLEYSIVSPK